MKVSISRGRDKTGSKIQKASPKELQIRKNEEAFRLLRA